MHLEVDHLEVSFLLLLQYSIWPERRALTCEEKSELSIQHVRPSCRPLAITRLPSQTDDIELSSDVMLDRTCATFGDGWPDRVWRTIVLQAAGEAGFCELNVVINAGIQ
jgi:hypothetical protein